MHPDSTNEVFHLAVDLVNNTAQNIFLTGKAGTGKTTFLKYIRQHTYKQVAVVAPTGVAAINAGGVTMHSFFQLPFEPFLPVRKNFGENPQYADKNNLFKKIMLGTIKRKVMEELELLIIDEVSMLRCDQLDCIDTILKGVRKNNYPFGGVQVLFIGDMYQLPPVIKDDEWNVLKEYYASPFFFDAQVMLEFELAYIELKKIYRQKEQKFIDILNHIRNNDADEFDFSALHERYFPNYFSENENKTIVITTHNYKADNINQTELRKLSGQEFVFDAIIEDDFNENALPTEKRLVLKPGAQIMFIKNDQGEDRKYYNGKLATIKSIFKEEITVVMQDDNSELLLGKETWENIRYTFNKEKGSIDEDVMGRFIQYPIRLAWAITIHKSQGLTFEKVVIDAGQSFAAGQVYVALSRCTTLEGMTLLSRITPQVISVDERIVTFSKRENHFDELQRILDQQKRKYLSTQLIQSFNFLKVISELEEYCEYLLTKNIPNKSETALMASEMLFKAKELNDVAEKFRSQLEKIFQQENFSMQVLQERAEKGILWFAENYAKGILLPLFIHLQNLKHASKVKQYLKEANKLYGYLESQLKKLFQLRYDDVVFITDERVIDNYLPQRENIPAAKQKKEKSAKPEKGETYNITLQLFKEGNKISEIAKLRNLAASTIEGHLARFILTGDVNIFDVMDESKIQLIKKAFETPEDNIGIVRQKLENVFSYGEVRMVANYLAISKTKA